MNDVSFLIFLIDAMSVQVMDTLNLGNQNLQKVAL